jgi:hypothetical protein
MALTSEGGAVAVNVVAHAVLENSEYVDLFPFLRIARTL